MANRSRFSRAARVLLGWVDAGRSSLVLALALALVVPSVNVVTFDGLPLDSLWEVGALAALLPFVFSASLRASLASVLRRRVTWGPRALVIATTAVVVIKLLLLGMGSDRGFVGCYSSTWKPPPQRCEESYSNLFKRHDGATRVDEEIDFGPSDVQASRLDQAFSSLVYTGGAGSTDWDLSFANDLRFNEGPAGTGFSLHELMPFDASWHGTAAIPDDGILRIQYVGGGSVRVGDRRVLLPPSDSSHTILAHVPSGDQPLEASFGFPEGASFAEFRILNQSGDAIGAAAPSIAEQLAALLVWLVLGVAFAGMAVVALSALGRDLLALGLVAIAALLVAALSSPEQHLGFQYLLAALAPIIVLRPPRRPVLWAFAALLVIEGAAVLNGVSELHSVLYHESGSDFLTYESFARNIVLGHSLDGGESVFYYQPGSRYVLGLMHLVFGDGNVLLTWWSMIGLSLPFVALISWQRRRVGSSLGRVAIAAAGFLLLAAVNSPTVLSLVALNASEAPTWALLPLAIAAPQLQPSRRRAWVGSAAAAGLIYAMRNNQALAVGTILAAIAAGLWKRRRGVLLAAAGTALAIAVLPAIHNLAYGQRLVFSTTSNALNQELSVSDLGQVFSDGTIGDQVRGHISAVLYDPPTPGLAHGSLAWLLWGMLALWLAAIVMSLWRLVRRESSLRAWLLLFVPVAYLAPHLIYQVEVYFPRHIIAGYLAMGVVALGTFAEVLSSGREWSLAGRARALGSLAGARLTALVADPPARSAGPHEPRRAIALATSGPVRFQRIGIGLVIAAVLAPFSATHIAGPLTLGRATLVLFAGLLAADLLRERPRRFRLDRPARLLTCAYVGLSVWIFLNAAAWGCNCDGKAGGFFEFAMIGLLALAAISFEPRLRGVAIIATLAGLVLAAALALAGVGSLNSGTVDLTQTGGRLSGTFGNSNELGFSAALGIPIAFAYRSVAGRARRIAIAATILILVITLVLTYSRGAIIAAAVGTFALALWQARGSRRRVAIILVAASASVLVAAVLYSVFQRERRNVSFTSVSPALRVLEQRDLSGWDSRALGPILHGPSKLFNQGSAIAVRATRGGQGASFRWGEARAGGAYTLRFRARAERPTRLPLTYALGDSAQKAEGPRAAGELSQHWRHFSLVWRPRLRSPHATIYVWQRAGPSTFELADVRVIARSRNLRSHIIAVPGHLKGSIYHRLTSDATREESRYIRSRLDAARLALRAFASEPLRGIGWSTFPAYAAVHLHYGQLAAHDEYLAFAAELGIVGVLLLGLLIAAVALGVRRIGPSRAEAAAIGVLAAAAAGLVFVEALPTPQLSIPIAVAAAVVCAHRRSVPG